MHFVLALTLLFVPDGADGGTAAQPQSTFDRAYELAYNLDHNEAIALLKQAAQTDPSSADAQRHVAVVTWLNVLFRRGSVTVDSYLGGVTRSNFKLPAPPADLDAGFKAYVAKAIALAQTRVDANARDGARGPDVEAL